MTDQVANADLETPASEQASEAIPDKQPTSEDVEATWRKRQAGADAARAEAEKKVKAYEAELEAYRAKEREFQDANLSAEAKLQAKLEAAEKAAEKARVEFEGKYLDRTFPKARAKFPEIRDEVRLAELEALYSEAPATAAPAPAEDLRAMRAPKDASAAKPAEEAVSAGWERFKSIPLPEAFRRIGTN